MAERTMTETSARMSEQMSRQSRRQRPRVTFRPLRAGDIDAVIDTDHDTWYADGTPFSREKAVLETTGLLRRVTWSSLAFLDGQFLGMITAAVKGEPPLDDEILAALDAREQDTRGRLGRSREGRRILADYDADFAENERFEAQARRELDAEAVLFFLRPQARGHQLGKRLFDAFIAHLDDAGLKTYWLFTDSSCSVGFYDHRGMRRTASLTTSVDYMPGLTKYIYTGFVDEDVQRYANMAGEIGH